MQNAILDGDVEKAEPESWINPKPDFRPADQLSVYIDGYRYRLFDIVYDDYPILLHYLGKKRFCKLIDDYVEANPSPHFNIARYILDFPEFVKNNEDELKRQLWTRESNTAAAVIMITRQMRQK